MELTELRLECEGCGGTYELETIRGEIFHRQCAPREWRRELEANERYMRSARSKRLSILLDPDDPFKRREV